MLLRPPKGANLKTLPSFAQTCGNLFFDAMVSYQQDPFLKNKQRKLFASRIWPPEYDTKVDISRVALDILRPWIEKRVTELLGDEDEIVSEYCVAQLEAFDPIEKTIEPREVQVNLEGFLGETEAAILMRDLWNLMLSAQSDPSGVPAQLREEKVKKEREAKERLERERKEREAKLEQQRTAVKKEDESRDRRRQSPVRRRDDRRGSPDDRRGPQVERRRRSPSPPRRREPEPRRERRKRSPERSVERDVKPRVERRKRTPSPSPVRTERRKRTPSPSPARAERRKRSPSPEERRQPRRKRTPSPSPARDDRRERARR